MPEVELLDKTEVWITGATLRDARLPDVAATTAAVLSLPRTSVVVTDVREHHFVLDVLQPRVMLEAVAGKERELLAALRGLPGVSLDSTARVHSFGVLGVIGTPQDQVGEMLAAAVEVEEGVRRYVSTRVAVVSTGAELRDRRVHDTNLEAIAEVLGAAGYEVSSGGTVVDDERTIAGRVARLVSDGFGCVITTGGVGAEDKDKTIEALQLLDPRLPTAVLARYTPGHGRHVKDAVRVAVTQIGWTTVIALPGPTPEVRLALPAILEALRRELTPPALAEAIAVVLRRQLRPHGVDG